MSKNFGTKLRNLRSLIGWSQTELAEEIGGSVTQTAVFRWETGKGEPSLGQLETLIEVLRSRVLWVSVDYLIRDSITEPPESAAANALSPAEEFVWTLVRDLGPIESRRRLIGAGLSWSQSDGPPQVIRPIRSITRRAEDLPAINLSPATAETPTDPDPTPTPEAPEPDPGPESKGDDKPKPKGRSPRKPESN